MSRQYDLGERRIIEILVGLQEKMRGNPLPFGDDASAVRLGRGKLAVLKCDMLVGLTDIPHGMSLWQASRKAIVSSVSDLAAKGVQPKAILVSLGLPRRVTEDRIREIGSGLNSGAREYGAFVLGGDTNESTDLTIDIFAFGVCLEKELVRRDTARVGDIVAVTGKFGLTGLGLRIVKENLPAPEKLRGEATHAVYMPKARLVEGVALAKGRLINSSIDSSDGLAWSLHELAKSSGVGFEIDNSPIHSGVKDFALKSGLDPVDLAFYGGEEYELVVTMRPSNYDRARRKVSDLTAIGRVTSDRGIILKSGGVVREIVPKGYEHFRESLNYETS